MRYGVQLTVTVFTMALAGCSSVAVVPEIELPQIPHQWTSSLAPATDQNEPWWSTLSAPGLAEAVEIALVKNPTLGQRRARLDAALAQARIAGASLKPQVGLGVNGSRRQQNFIGLPIPGADGGVLTSTSTTVGVSLDTAWEIDLWGRGRANRAAARSMVAASELELTATGLSIAAQTAKAWTAVAESAAQLELSQQTVSNRVRARERIERRFELGIATALQVRLARSEEQIANADLQQSDLSHDAIQRQFEVLLRQYPTGQVAAGSLPDLPAISSDSLPTDLIARRPDLLALEARLDAAGYSLLEAKRSLYPRLSLNGSVGRTGQEMADLLESDFDVWSLAGGLLQPLFQGGRLRAAVDLSRAQRDELVALYVQTLLDAYREVETRLAAEDRLAALEDALAAAEQESRSAVDLAEREYSRGINDYLVVLRTQTDHLNAARRRLSVRAQRLSNRIDLHLALGDGLDTIRDRQRSQMPSSSSQGHSPRVSKQEPQ